MKNNIITLWVFHGMGGRFASGVFTQIEKAEEWIAKYGLIGILTEYPVDISTYDWAISEGFFEVKKSFQSESEFIGQFSSASQNHYHYEDGLRD